MAIGVHVREYSGATVARLEEPIDVNGLCAVAGRDVDRYPLLSGVDEYDDTYFNARQAVRLVHELVALAGAEGTASVRQAAGFIIGLARLVEPAPGRANHRLLVFVGD